MGEYTIRDLVNLSGVKAHTLRVWEKRYGIIHPHRTHGNMRTYCDSDLKNLLNISFLNRKGIKISRIARLTPQEISQQVRELAEVTGPVTARIENLVHAMIDMDEFSFEQTLARCVIQYGFEEAVIQVIFPFLEKVGLLWQTGYITPLQEHFVSNLIRQKLFVALDGLVREQNDNQKNMVFFLPEGEWHEISLLFFCYLARKRHFKTTYLGQSVPLHELENLTRALGVNYLATSFMSSGDDNRLFSFSQKLASSFPEQGIIIYTSPASGTAGTIPANIRVVSSPYGFIAELEKICPRNPAV